MRGTGAPDVKTLAAYLEGELSQSEAQAIETAVAGSAALRTELDGLRQIREALGTVDEDVARRNLVPKVRDALTRPAGRGDVRSRSLRLSLSLAGAGLAVVTAIVALTYLRPGDYRPKGGAGADEEAWVGLQVFRTVDDSQPVRVEREISSRDALAFAYSNLGPRPFSHLMIFAVDGEGAIYWYHPPHEQAGADPRSRRIEARGDVELREAVTHRLRPGPLVLYAVFTRKALGVRQVEATVDELRRKKSWSAANPGRLPFTESAQKMIRLKVSP